MPEGVNATDVVQWANEGLAFLLVIAGIWFSIRVFTWIGTNIVVPIRDAHVRYLTTVDACLRNQEDVSRQQGETMKLHGETMRVQTEILRGLQTDMAFVRTYIEKIGDKS